MKTATGWICDKCGKSFQYEPVIAQGKKRELHFCSLKHKGTYLKLKG